MYSIPIGFRFRDATRCQRLWLIDFCAASQTAARAAAATCGTLTLQLQFNRNFSAQIEEFSPRHFFYCFYLMRFTVSSLFFALRFVSFRSFIVLNDLSFLFHSLSHSLFLSLSLSFLHPQSTRGSHLHFYSIHFIVFHQRAAFTVTVTARTGGPHTQTPTRTAMPMRTDWQCTLGCLYNLVLNSGQSFLFFGSSLCRVSQQDAGGALVSCSSCSSCS